jgi:prolyl-tRNA synthetase
MGALIMAHSDDQGLVLPPKLATLQIVIVPIYKGEDQLEEIRAKIEPIVATLLKKGISVRFDDRDTERPGFKFAEWELKGVPVRLALGQRDLANGTVEVARRDTGEKQTLSADDTLADKLEALLNEIQDNIYEKALAFRKANTHVVDSWEDFIKTLDDKGGFILAHWDGTAETENKIKEQTKATIRCIPLPGQFNEAEEGDGKCILTGQPSAQRVVFARAY